jgi:Fe-S-cluster containining protein
VAVPLTHADCQRCGACCTNPDENRAEGFAFYVEVEPDSRLLRIDALKKRYVVFDAAGVPHLRLDPSGRCTALRGRLGHRVECAIYADRAPGCRKVEPDTPECLKMRSQRGL